jgi:hypothetical protein
VEHLLPPRPGGPGVNGIFGARYAKALTKARTKAEGFTAASTSKRMTYFGETLPGILGENMLSLFFSFMSHFQFFLRKKKVGLNSIHKKAMVTVHFPNEIVCFAIYERCNRLSDQAVYTCKGVLD